MALSSHSLLLGQVAEKKDFKQLQANPHFLEKMDSLSQFNTMNFLNDTDLSSLAVNKSFASKVQHENRWKEKLKEALFRGIYQQRLFNLLSEGKSLVKDLKEEAEISLDSQVKSEIKRIFEDFNRWKITNFQAIYARFKKLGGSLLNEDEFILLSGNVEATKNWLEKNVARVRRNEFLDLKGFCPIHYIAVTGNVDALRVYKDFGDVTVKTRIGSGVQLQTALSGSVAAMKVSAHEFKLDMQECNFEQYGVLHSSAYSGNLSALRASKEIFKLKKIPHSEILELVAEKGSEEMLLYCAETLKMPMTVLNADRYNIPYIAARAGNREAIEASVVLDLNLDFVSQDDVSLINAATLSGKVEAVRTCKKFIGPLKHTSVPISYCAGVSGNISMLRFWHDQKYDLTKEYKPDGELGVQQHLHHLVAKSGGLDEINFCKKIGLDITTPQSDGKNILHIAAKNGNSTLIREYAKLGVDINKVDSSGFGLLHYAALGDDPFTLLSCIELGLDMKTITHNPLLQQYIYGERDPAMLILLKILNIPIDNALRGMARESGDKLTRMFAKILLATPDARTNSALTADME